jgi:oligoribonuclease
VIRHRCRCSGAIASWSDRHYSSTVQPWVREPAGFGAPRYDRVVLAWMDLEMTGLDPTRHVVVEIATLLTDDDLQPVAEGPDIVIHATAEELEQMDGVVVAMHTRSGLLAEIQASDASVAEACEQTLAFLQAHIPEARTVPLCGNSIGTDRRFLAAYMPEVEHFLHYRSIDVSTIKELCRRWYPDVLARVPPKREAHRALGDIRESIAELAYYRSTIFIPGVTAPASR